jgi:hypothetical protein
MLLAMLLNRTFATCPTFSECCMLPCGVQNVAGALLHMKGDRYHRPVAKSSLNEKGSRSMSPGSFAARYFRSIVQSRCFAPILLITNWMQNRSTWQFT